MTEVPTATRSIRLFIAEDEPPARELLRAHAARHPELEVLGEAGDGATAARRIKELGPDLVLMDVEMPEMDGFAVLAELNRSGFDLPRVVFVTAYDRYAVRAFDVNAVDYLLKPVTHEQFDRAIDRCLVLGEDPAAGKKVQALLEDALHLPPQRLLVRDRGRIVPVPVDSIDRIHAERDYVRIHRGPESYLVERTISDMERLLTPRGFARVHRGTLVNLERIRELRAVGSGRYRLLCHDGTELVVSRSYSGQFRDRIL